jgi:hypothetical protein
MFHSLILKWRSLSLILRFHYKKQHQLILRFLLLQLMFHRL